MALTFISVMPSSTVVAQERFRRLPYLPYVVYIVMASPRQRLTQHLIHLNGTKGSFKTMPYMQPTLLKKSASNCKNTMFH